MFQTKAQTLAVLSVFGCVLLAADCKSSRTGAGQDTSVDPADTSTNPEDATTENMGVVDMTVVDMTAVDMTADDVPVGDSNADDSPGPDRQLCQALCDTTAGTLCADPTADCVPRCERPLADRCGSAYRDLIMCAIAAGPTAFHCEGSGVELLPGFCAAETAAGAACRMGDAGTSG